MQSTHNLARKWRPQTFEQMVGQDLCIRILKNTLYKNRFFPVYLFCGKSGCGKTTAARIFAAATNCELLLQFRDGPKDTPLPCLACTSCHAMKAGTHPDFIEIDGASHTGVDNIRSIIDASNLLPLLGGRKIYLIDEAHMLSRASFNALLKIFEEPPPSAFFILATTDRHKIIETVSSRCLKLFFQAIENPAIASHLATICSHEGFEYENAALEVIAQKAQGKIRDAINLLEEIFFAGERVGEKEVRRFFGYAENELIERMLQGILQRNAPSLLLLLKEERGDQSAEILWAQILEAVRASLWLQQGFISKELSQWDTPFLRELVRQFSSNQLQDIFETLYRYEHLFLQSGEKNGFLEMTLLELCRPLEHSPIKGTSHPTEAAVHPAPSVPEASTSDAAIERTWKSFLQALAIVQDPLLSSFFEGAHRSSMQKGALNVVMPEDKEFLHDLVTEKTALWLPLLERWYGTPLRVTFHFERPKNEQGAVEKKNLMKVGTTASTNAQQSVESMEWPRRSKLLALFPGSITTVKSE